jgi:spore coat polysaccharide biosynthesis protein SpsF (cytidylyltransferase family)
MIVMHPQTTDPSLAIRLSALKQKLRYAIQYDEDFHAIKKLYEEVKELECHLMTKLQSSLN